MSKKNFFLLTLTADFLASMSKESLGVNSDGVAPELYVICGKVQRGEQLTEEESAVTTTEKWPGIVLGFQKAELAQWVASTDFPFSNREAAVAPEDLDLVLESVVTMGTGNPTTAGSEAYAAREILETQFGALLNPEAYATPAAVEDVVNALVEPDAAETTTEPVADVNGAEEDQGTETQNLPQIPTPSVVPTPATSNFGLAATQMSEVYTALKGAKAQMQNALAAVDQQIDTITATALQSMTNAATLLDANTAGAEDVESEDVAPAEVTA